MKYALVNTIPCELSYWVWEEDNGIRNQVYKTVTAEPGTIINVIQYQEGSSYTPPANMEIRQVADEADIGDLAS